MDTIIGGKMFEGLKGSLSVPSRGPNVMVPVREDYVAELRKRGLVRNEREFQDSPDLADAVYSHWQTRPQIACIFARMMAPNLADFGIFRMVYPGAIRKTDVRPIAKAAASFVTNSIADPKCEAASILIPGLLDAPSLVALCRAIGKHDGWSIKAATNPSDRLDRVYVELRRNVGDGVLAEALGFGPFDFLPLTRRAPVTAIELRTKPDFASDPKDPFKEPRAHLADMLNTGLRGTEFEHAWRGSGSARARVLGGNDSAARARVAFAIPETHWLNRQKPSERRNNVA